MAQVNDLLIMGKTRALNPINGSCTNGTTVTTQTQSTKFMREDGTWSAPSYTAATTDKYHTTGTWSGLTYTATANGGAGALAFTIPTGTTASTVCVGNDSRLSDARTPKSHTHGNIQNGGTLQTNDITIANGDKLVVTDSSDSSKVARTSISFDGSTATQCLTKKGTWETFASSNTDTKVTQTNITTAATYSIPLCKTYNTTTETDSLYKNLGLSYSLNGNQAGLCINEPGKDDASTLSAAAISNQAIQMMSRASTTATPDILAISSTDISFLTTGTWDGTNVSLKKAVTAAKGTVTQTPTNSTNSTYELLFSGTADNTEHTESTKKDNHLRYNPGSTFPTLEVIDGIPDGRSSVTAITGHDITISNNMDPGELVVSNSDVSLDLTWDGTNTSLKTAITTLADRNWYTYVEFTDKNNVAANTVTNLGTWKPTVGGVYLIQYVARFSSNATGYRKLSISTSSSTISGMDRFGQISSPACNGDHTYIELVAIETLTANTTYYFNAYHSASAAVNISYPGLKIMRIR